MMAKENLSEEEGRSFLTLMGHPHSDELVSCLVKDNELYQLYRASQEKILSYVVQLQSKQLETHEESGSSSTAAEKSLDETVIDSQSHTELPSLNSGQTKDTTGESDPDVIFENPTDSEIESEVSCSHKAGCIITPGPEEKVIPVELPELQQEKNGKSISTSVSGDDESIVDISNKEGGIVGEEPSAKGTEDKVLTVENKITHFPQRASTEQQKPHPQLKTLNIQLPNGMVGREYQNALPVNDFRPVSNLLPDELALKFEQDEQIISGTPKASGDYELKFKGVISSADKQHQPTLIIARLTVNPDPRSLWQDLPSDSEALFHKPDFYTCGYEHDNMRLLASSRRGRSHAHKGTHRDDEARVEWLSESGWHILAVADGAGSCQYSRRGSQLALEVAIDHLCQELGGDAGKALYDACLTQDDINSTFNATTSKAIHQTLITAAWNAASAIRTEAVDNQFSAKEFSTTLLILLHKPTIDGHLVIGFSIGDGAIVAYDAENGVNLLCTPDSGEFAGQTRFLDTGLFQNQDIYQRVKITLIPSFTALMAMTDGITDAKFDTETQLSQKAPWDSLWSELSPQLEGDLEEVEIQMLEWLNFFIPGHHDDRSITLLSRINDNE